MKTAYVGCYLLIEWYNKNSIKQGKFQIPAAFSK
jgi:hypothetical protein